MGFQILLTGAFLLCLTGDSNAQVSWQVVFQDLGCMRTCDCPEKVIATCAVPAPCDGVQVPTGNGPYCLGWGLGLVDWVVYILPQCEVIPGQTCGDDVYPCREISRNKYDGASFNSFTNELFTKLFAGAKTRLATSNETEEFKKYHPEEYSQLYEVAAAKSRLGKDTRDKRQTACYEANAIEENNCFASWFSNQGDCCKNDEFCGGNETLVEPHCKNIRYFSGWGTLDIPTYIDASLPAVECN